MVGAAFSLRLRMLDLPASSGTDYTIVFEYKAFPTKVTETGRSVKNAPECFGGSI